MAFMEYLKIGEEVLPLPTSYSVSLDDVKADSSGETEAGTTQRDVVRSGVVSISASFQVSQTWLKKLSQLRRMPILTVRYLDTDSFEYVTTKMYMDGFQYSLEKDTSYKGLWKVSFSLHEF
jgi:hypothetical protein